MSEFLSFLDIDSYLQNVTQYQSALACMQGASLHVFFFSQALARRSLARHAVSDQDARSSALWRGVLRLHAIQR